MPERPPFQEPTSRPEERPVPRPPERRVETDPENGFEILWKAGEPGKMQYSLLKVPLGTNPKLFFHNPDKELEFTMQRQRSGLWAVSGIIDADIVSQMDLPVQRERRGQKAPIIGEENMVFLAKRGTVTVVDAEEELLDVALMLRPEKITKFLASVWQPQEIRKRDNVTNLIPPIKVQLLPADPEPYRVLPQKFPRNPNRQTSLTVIRG